ncbi:MAG TPA: SGNH/GDSL hydrolase family protein [Polyangia bacterium]|jgi:lysophospholipase L1-like esterase|nr:SGNH/GDSL hydrolase family protein [Polyangia bacterium]
MTSCSFTGLSCSLAAAAIALAPLVVGCSRAGTVTVPDAAGEGVGGRAAGGPGAGGASGLGGQAGVLRIMPLGDSVTAATCWRALLWQQLNQAGLQGRFDLVGSNTSNSDVAGACTPSSADANNEGHSSCLITEIINNVNAQTSRGCNTTLNALTPALAADRADVVLMHFGTNDVWNQIQAGPILTASAAMIDSLRAVNPRVVVLVAQIIPMNVTSSTCAGCSCANCAADIPTLNNMIATWAAGKSTTSSPVIPVDQYTGFDAAAGADTSDGVHPNRSGSAKIAARWLAALQPWF